MSAAGQDVVLLWQIVGGVCWIGWGISLFIIGRLYERLAELHKQRIMNVGGKMYLFTQDSATQATLTHTGHEVQP